MGSFEAWRKCFDDAGIDQPECWSEGLLKPHGHTISVSDLAYIGGFHGMVALRVGEIKNYRKDGHGVLLKDGSEINLDIVIKCTGFHLNEDVPKITGHSKIHPNYLLDFQLSYSAEPVLDGGQFGSSKGMASHDHIRDKTVEAIFFSNLETNYKILPNYAQELFRPRGNPFGSGYVGGAMAGAENLAWLTMRPETQKLVLRHLGNPALDAIQLWASQIGVGHDEMSRRLFVKLLQAKGIVSIEPSANIVDVE